MQKKKSSKFTINAEFYWWLFRWFVSHPEFCKNTHCCYLSPQRWCSPRCTGISALLCLSVSPSLRYLWPTHLPVMATVFFILILLLGRVTWTLRASWKLPCGTGSHFAILLMWHSTIPSRQGHCFPSCHTCSQKATSCPQNGYCFGL